MFGLASLPWAATAAMAIAAAIFFGLWRIDEAALLRKEHAIANLQGAIQMQNKGIEDVIAASDAAKKQLIAAQAASRARTAATQKTVTALLTKPLAPADAACAAADKEILEYIK